MTTRRNLTLGDLFADVPPAFAEHPINDLAFDSRAVTPGSAFVAIPGTVADGMRFARDAAQRGAVAVVGEGERPADLPGETAYLRVADARLALTLAASRLHPAQPARIAAVTGTSGKSSVADFTRQLLAGLGRHAASLGTLGVITSTGAAYGSLTTPDPITLHQTLARLAADGVSDLVMEASSHGIEQRRLDGVRLAAAAFTNFGRDHLDYHLTTEAYLAAKLRLFDTLLEPGCPAVANVDSPEGARVAALAEQRGCRLVSVGREGRDLTLLRERPDGFAQRLTLRHDGRIVEISLPLAGSFQVENALVAAGLAEALAGTDRMDDILDGLSRLTGVPGRLERIGEVNGALVVVDYAHKPEALAHVLAALRPFASRQLVCVFGCGGDRDRGKRPIMGRIAVEGADLVVVTDDNPRSERPEAIRAEILAAAPGAREIADRGEAIATAVRGLRPGDVLVVAGKGHETGQIVGKETLPFSDHEAVRAAIAERDR
jgi:UDP-N-acetylmuramoyl-L-alanyl-D-glutamate--2,6-diaminopimelate ligase